MESMAETPKCNTYVHVNTAGNQTSEEDNKPTNSTKDISNPKESAHDSEILSDDDDFIPQKGTLKRSIDFSSSEDEMYTQNETAEVVITEMLPENYHYKFIEIFEHDHTGLYHCKFRLKLQSEEDARKWVADYNDKTKETMVYE